MIAFLYIPLILLLYFRTWKYKFLIDDPVPRDGVGYVITEGKETSEFKGMTIVRDRTFYEKQRPIFQTVVNIGVFIAVCGYIHYFWGWKSALLYALFPLNVSGVAWGRTGNYYMSACLMILATHLLMQYGPIGVLASTVMFAGALNQMVSAIPYFIISLLYPFGWIQIVPLLTFLFGKRMQTGIKKRKEIHANRNAISGKFEIRNFIICYKTIAYYIVLSLWPNKLGFFHEYSRAYPGIFTVRNTFLSCVLVSLWLYWTYTIDPFMALWWILFIGIFSQFTTMGQFISERYTMVPNVAFCVIISKALEPYPYLYTILCTLYFYRSHLYIPAWKNNEMLFNYSSKQFPKAVENYNNLASYYLDYKQLVYAVEPLLGAFKYAHGTKFNICWNLGLVYQQIAEYPRALHYFQLALKQPDCPQKDVEDLKARIEAIKLRIDRINQNNHKLRKMQII